ncbi:hypothetical protein Cfor_10761 [Coptotermes formosanus]|uniref:Uncharacterized protein n=1 Tax=Coptotermes formosanus TaxID=36987 RepID=A0A6L2PF69_COPFO|nr:hypothetical protein Cfor_10761 [Coptotermes formosanus]
MAKDQGNTAETRCLEHTSDVEVSGTPFSVHESFYCSRFPQRSRRWLFAHLWGCTSVRTRM